MTSLELKTGEILRWDPKGNDCGVLRNDENGDWELVVRITDLDTKAKIYPEDGLNLITPHCLGRIKSMFPATQSMKQQVRKPWQKRHARSVDRPRS